MLFSSISILPQPLSIFLPAFPWISTSQLFYFARIRDCIHLGLFLFPPLLFILYLLLYDTHHLCMAINSSFNIFHFPSVFFLYSDLSRFHPELHTSSQPFSLELQFSLILCTPSRRSKQIMATIQVPPSPCPTKHWCDISTALSAQLHCANYVGRQPQEQTSPRLTCDAKEILCWQVKEHKKAKKKNT